ncbi:MAG: tetratricopeptide repeat protein [Ignavibacteriaceae bacterium]
MKFHYLLTILLLLFLGCQKSSKDYYKDGMKYLSNDDTTLAIEAFRNSLKFNPADTSCIMYLGKCFYGQGNYDTAIYYFNQVYGLNKLNENCIYFLALSYLYLGNNLKASQLADTLLKFRPKEAEYYWVKGISNLRLKKYNESKDYLLSAIELDSTVSGGYFGLALSYNYLDKLDSALFYAKKSFDLQKDYKSRFLLGSIYLLRLNNLEGYSKELDKFIDAIMSDNAREDENYNSENE